MHVVGVLKLPLFPKVTEPIAAWYRGHVSKVPGPEKRLSVKTYFDKYEGEEEGTVDGLPLAVPLSSPLAAAQDLIDYKLTMMR